MASGRWQPLPLSIDPVRLQQALWAAGRPALQGLTCVVVIAPIGWLLSPGVVQAQFTASPSSLQEWQVGAAGDAAAHGGVVAAVSAMAAKAAIRKPSSALSRCCFGRRGGQPAYQRLPVVVLLGAPAWRALSRVIVSSLWRQVGVGSSRLLHSWASVPRGLHSEGGGEGASPAVGAACSRCCDGVRGCITVVCTATAHTCPGCSGAGRCRT